MSSKLMEAQKEIDALLRAIDKQDETIIRLELHNQLLRDLAYAVKSGVGIQRKLSAVISGGALEGGE